MSTEKSNEQWNSLCSLATELFPRYGSRLRAFRAACEQRPDLASVAMDPVGNPVFAGIQRAERGAR